MRIQTESGIISGNKRDSYVKWVQGWIDGNGWSGHSTLVSAWKQAQAQHKPKGCSWYAYGYLMATQQAVGRNLAEWELKQNGFLPWEDNYSLTLADIMKGIKDFSDQEIEELSALLDSMKK